jgi:hypothetical protein
MKLAGKTRPELESLLSDKTRGELFDVIFSLTTFDQLLTARQIADASHVSKRDVLADIKAGRFIDPIFGRGFFCRASNSLRVSASAANAWRHSFFVPVNSLPSHKKERAASEIDVAGKNAGQKAMVRELSPVFLARRADNGF